MEALYFFGTAILVLGGLAAVVYAVASREEAKKTSKLNKEFLNRIYGIQGV